MTTIELFCSHRDNTTGAKRKPFDLGFLTDDRPGPPFDYSSQPRWRIGWWKVADETPNMKRARLDQRATLRLLAEPSIEEMVKPDGSTLYRATCSHCAISWDQDEDGVSAIADDTPTDVVRVDISKS